MKVENVSSQNFGMAYIRPTHPYTLKEYKTFINTNNFFVNRGLKQLEKHQKNNIFNIVYERSRKVSGTNGEEFIPASFRTTIDNRYAGKETFVVTKKTGLMAAMEEIDKKYTNKIARAYHKIKTYLKAIFIQPKLFLPEALLNAEKQAIDLFVDLKSR